ncbi:unnamed protein product [Wuchereria bancrofti]|uniref:Uncharacterized protein n=2 Tax=Wuchereria bancrofti TaxID=6293 RepID=A0A3P7DC44_WUCBA|nr:unnamed protein product [Wuchereria bancrofti]
MDENEYCEQWVEEICGNKLLLTATCLEGVVCFTRSLFTTNKNPSKSVITAKVWVAPPAPQKHQQQKSEDPRESVKKCQQSDRSFYE